MPRLLLDTDIALTLAVLHAAYANGTMRPEAAVALVHRRIVALGDPGIFTHLVPQAEAEAAARALPPLEPRRFLLWGLPVAMKDNIDIAGLRTTAS